MKHNYILAIILICTLSLMHAADESDDLPDIFTFYTNQLKGANDLHVTPQIKHHVDSYAQETLSERTFRELFSTNACQRSVPWLLATLLVRRQNQNQIFDYWDIVELLKKQNCVYQSSDFASNKTTAQIIRQAIIHEASIRYPSSIQSINYHTSCLYYATENSIHFENFAQPPIMTFDKRGSDTISDVSCTLAIALCDDYSQLPQILTTLTLHEARLSPHVKQKKNFWGETFVSLPDEKQKTLLKEAKARLGYDLIITRNPS